MHTDDNRYLKWGLTAFLVLAGAIGVVFFLMRFPVISLFVKRIIGILMPVIYGAVMAYLMAPVYNRVCRLILEKRGRETTPGKKRVAFAKTVATLVAVVVLLAVVLGLVLMMLPELYRSVTNVLNALPANIDRLQDWISNALSEDGSYHDQAMILYDHVSEMGENFINNDLKPNVARILQDAYTGVMNVARNLYDLSIGLIVMIYLLNIKDTLVPQLKKLIFTLFPVKWAGLLVSELHYINQVFGGFILGKIVDSLIIGVMCFSILSLLNAAGILHMPYVLLVSVIVGVTNVIPFFGPFIGAVPSVFLVLLSDPLQALWLALFIFLLQQFDGNYLGPKILGDRTGISSFWVLFSILLFGGLYGFVGMIIAVPTWAVLMNLVGRISARVLRKKDLPTDLSYYREL